MITTILIFISFLIFCTYIGICVAKFDIPWSLSKTYYLLEVKKKGLGWIFTIFMWLLAFLTTPGWILVSEKIGSWHSYFTFLAFISGAMMAFVGTAPRFMDNFEGKVHTISAIVCGICALAWCFLVCTDLWWVTLLGVIIPIIIATCTKTWKQGRDFWLELSVFFGTYVTLMTEAIKQLV